MPSFEFADGVDRPRSNARLNDSPPGEVEGTGASSGKYSTFTRRSFVASFSALLLGAGLKWPALAASLPSVLRTAMTGTSAPALGALVIRNRKVAEIAVYGLRRIGRPEHVEDGDRWLIGSCTKPMTATLIARLVDRGELSWTAPLSTMLPSLAQIMRPDYRSVTLVQLLSHRAGLPYDDDLMLETHDFFHDHRPLPQQRFAYVTDGLKQAPVSAPGTAFHYSNIGFILAGVIAERATGIPYEQLMRREIFEPLQMFSAVFGPPPDDGSFVGHRAGRPAKVTDSAPFMYAPAGPVRLTLNDWAKFCLDQLAGAKGRGKLLSQASYHLMQTRYPGTDDGVGWGLDSCIEGRKGPVLEHTGTDRNWYALVNLFPATGDGILLAANAGEGMGGEKAVYAALKALLPTVSKPA